MTEVRGPSAADVRALLGDALQRPAQEGARLVALQWLYQLADARASWREGVRVSDGTAEAGEGSSAETLHRARVALRRLRATLRENDRVLDGVEDRRIARALRKLGRTTNAMREADVQRAWLESELEHLPEEARPEAALVRARLETEATGSHLEVELAFARHFDPISDTLVARLSSYRLLQRVGMDSTPMPFARHLAARLGRGGTRLRRDLERVADVGAQDAQDALHRIRIRLKRHRALLAPFARSRPALGAWFDLATRGQDLLGTMRDADQLAHRARKAKLPALERALRDIVLSHHAAFIDSWCGRLDDTLRVLDAATAALRTEGTPRSSAGLPMEIERKFLLRGCPPEARALPPLHIEQGWIPGVALRERLRRRVAPDGTVSCWRTMKLGPAEARIEVEEVTTPELFDAMWPLTRSARIRKVRHVLADHAHTWEIDVFLDRDLVLAEVELGDVTEPVALPAWLAPYVEREVTGEPAYFNAVLARAESDAGTVNP